MNYIKDRKIINLKHYIDKKNIIRKTFSSFDFNASLLKGLYLILETKELTVFGNKKGYFTHYSFDPSYDLPNSVEKIQVKDDYKYLIWISNSKCNNSDIDFCWALSHELQHFHKHINQDKFFMDLPKIQGIYDNKNELEADFVAKCTCCRLFGKKTIGIYLSNFPSSKKISLLKKIKFQERV